MFDLLRQIEERNFGPIETLDQGDDIPDSDLLNGFLEGFNEEDQPIENHRKIHHFIICIIMIILSFTIYHMLMIIQH